MRVPAPDAAGRHIVFRCDAGPSHGVGHVMRCVALGEEFASRGHQITFVANLDSVPWARAQVLGRGFGHIQPPEGVDPDSEIRSLVSTRPSLVVLDSYTLPTTVYTGIRSAMVPTLAIVDGDPAGRPADLWLDQNIGAEADTWPVPPGTHRLAGLDYALMRSELLAARPAAPRWEDSDPVAVFAFFGGTDAFGAAPQVLAALIGTGIPFGARVVAATDELADACAGLTLQDGQRVRVIGPTSQISEEVLAADVVLSAAGTSSWELLCLGAAAGLVCVAENQAVSYHRAVGAGLVQGLGYLDQLDGRLDGPAPALAALLTSETLRRELRRSAWSKVDGRGRVRVVEDCVALIDGRTQT